MKKDKIEKKIIKQNNNNTRLQKTLKKNDIKILPNHVAFILDGNRRWAKENGKNANFGHQKGAENVKNLCEMCLKYKIKYLTLYCLSIENLQRSKQELNFLFRTIKNNLTQENIKKYNEQDNVNINIIGDRSVLPENLQKHIEKIDKIKIKNAKLELQICFGYSGRNEIVNAVKNIIKDEKNKKLKINDIDEKTFEKYLFTSNIPDVDLMIRTGGDIRISNFLLWKLSYAELYFCDTYFPAFSEKDFLLALYNFQSRKRRYGK